MTIVGNVLTDPNHKVTMGDVDLTTFRMASNARRYDKERDEWVNGRQVFVDVTCWRKLASTAAVVLAKGDPVIVTGRLYTKEYEVDGKRRSNTVMESTAIGLDLARIAVTPHRRRKERPASPAPAAGATGLAEQFGKPIEPPEGGQPAVAAGSVGPEPDRELVATSG